MIPPAEWAERSARPGDALMRFFSAKSDAMRLLRGYIRALEGNGFAGPIESSKIVRRHIVDLVVLAATPHGSIGESRASAVVASRIATAVGLIASSFQNPDFSLSMVARCLRISPRYLQRLLEMSGTPFTERVNELRLQKAYALLAEAHDGGRRISDIALEVGFSDVAHFNRLFRSRFCDTPSGVRAQGRGMK
jgi:AraC-like DNA-binding protein